MFDPGEWLEYFRRDGFPNVIVLASGVEGSVYALDEDRVAKVWFGQNTDYLTRLRSFYDELVLPFDTPQIFEVRLVDGVAVSFEKRLHGEPLQNVLSTDASRAEDVGVDAVSSVLDGLRNTRPSLRMQQFSALGNKDLRHEPDFRRSICALLRTRFARSQHLLTRRVERCERKFERLLSLITELDALADVVMHGDVFGENILVDKSGSVTALLDFMYPSRGGDPRYEAAISAAIFNMYGPHSQTITTELTAVFAAEFGYSVESLTVYRAAYAVITNSFLTTDGSDGHFEWCVQVLNSRAVSEVLSTG